LSPRPRAGDLRDSGFWPPSPSGSPEACGTGILLGERREAGNEKIVSKGKEIARSTVCNQRGLLFKEEAAMYFTDIIWWAYTAFVVAAALFMIVFAYKVRQKGE
jgi:hypothetical protein